MKGNEKWQYKMNLDNHIEQSHELNQRNKAQPISVGCMSPFVWKFMKKPTLIHYVRVKIMLILVQLQFRYAPLLCLCGISIGIFPCKQSLPREHMNCAFCCPHLYVNIKVNIIISVRREVLDRIFFIKILIIKKVNNKRCCKKVKKYSTYNQPHNFPEVTIIF